MSSPVKYGAIFLAACMVGIIAVSLYPSDLAHPFPPSNQVENVYTIYPQTSFTLGVTVPDPPKGNPPDSRFDLTRPIWTNDYYGWPPYSNNLKAYHRDTRARAGVGPAPGPRPSFTHSDVYYTRPTPPKALDSIEGTLTFGTITPGDWTKDGNIV